MFEVFESATGLLDLGDRPEDQDAVRLVGGVGGTGPDASGGGSAIVIQMLQQTSGNTAIATSASSSRYAARTTAH